MKKVETDLNNVGKDMFNITSVNLRRFRDTPEVGDIYLLVDGEDSLVGEVIDVGDKQAVFNLLSRKVIDTLRDMGPS